MKLLSLKLKNFKGIRSFELDAQGEDMSIYGDNATGKTTLMDAFLWLLFSKDSANRADFNIKTLTEDGEALHGLDHSVEATIEMDGKTMTLQKIYSEKWTRHRKEASKTFSGHTTDHFLDGVPVKKKEYDAAVADIADEGVFKLITNPLYFNDALHWEKRRALLLEVCGGDISDADVIASDKALVELPGILGDRTLNDHRKVIAARQAKINEVREDIRVRIDEVNHGLPELPKAKRSAYENELNILDTLKGDKGEQRLRLEAGGEIAEKKKALAQLDAELLDMQNKLRADIMEKAKAERARKGELDNKADSLSSGIRSKKNTLRDNQREIERLEARMKQLRANWDVENEKTFEFEQSDTCPTCGQALPAEQLQEARDKALAAFNQAKAKELEEITAQGKDDKARAGELALENTGLEKEIKAAEEQLEEVDRDAAEVQKGIDELSAQAEDTAKNPAYVEKAEGKQILLDAIAELKAGNEEALAKVDAELEELSAKMAAVKSSVAAFKAHEAGQVRIEELMTQESTLSKEYEGLELEQDLCDEFVRAKVRMLDEKINSRFKLARFKLFNVLVNGGIEECCETTFDGVPWNSNLNSGAKVNVGIDIINTLSDHYGFSAPIFADNAESVTEITPTEAQLIRLVVSKPDKKLRVEIEDPKTKKEAV